MTLFSSLSCLCTTLSFLLMDLTCVCVCRPMAAAAAAAGAGAATRIIYKARRVTMASIVERASFEYGIPPAGLVDAICDFFPIRGVAAATQISQFHALITRACERGLDIPFGLFGYAAVGQRTSDGAILVSDEDCRFNRTVIGALMAHPNFVWEPGIIHVSPAVVKLAIHATLTEPPPSSPDPEADAVAVLARDVAAMTALRHFDEWMIAPSRPSVHKSDDFLEFVLVRALASPDGSPLYTLCQLILESAMAMNIWPRVIAAIHVRIVDYEFPSTGNRPGDSVYRNVIIQRARRARCRLQTLADQADLLVKSGPEFFMVLQGLPWLPEALVPLCCEYLITADVTQRLLATSEQFARVCFTLEHNEVTYRMFELGCQRVVSGMYGLTPDPRSRCDCTRDACPFKGKGVITPELLDNLEASRAATLPVPSP
jgi:hypothetical protein